MKSPLLLVLLIGCAPQPKKSPQTAAAATPQQPKKSLYERLGGKDAIVAVVGEFVGRTAADKRINQRFFNTDIPALKNFLVEFVCVATGGPCKYTGRDMQSAHEGMELVEEEFNALVGNLKGALDKFQVPEREQNELLGALGPLKPQIIVSGLAPLDAAKLDSVTRLAATLKVPEAQELLALAVAAGRRGQRSYAEQLFLRAELLVGADAIAPAALVFREGAPPRVSTALKVLPKDSAPQPGAVGNSDEDEPDKKPARGSLKGTLRVGGQPLSGFAVVMLEPAGGKWKKRAPKQRVIEQRGKLFAPRIMAVPVGSTVAFPNFDPIYHNVFSLSAERPFDLGIYKNGETREVTFDKEGIIRVGCNLHPNMLAHLLVVAAPHYAVVNADGSFWFRSLAPGKYKLKAWSDTSAAPTVAQLEIKVGENKNDIGLKADGPPSPNANKFGTPRAKGAQ